MSELEHVEALLAWFHHMLDEHTLLVWIAFCYFVCSGAAIAVLAAKP